MRFRPIPRDERYFDLLAESARHVVVGASLLARLLGADRHERAELAERLRTAESEADQVTHTIMQRLSKTFVTPFDRDDIYALASGIDDCMDYMDEAGDLIVLYKLEALPDGVSELVGVLQRCAELTAEAMPRLVDLQDLREYWVEINRLENQADRAYRRLLAQIFDDGTDAITVIKLKGVIDALENGADAFESLANVVETVALKES